MTPIYEQGNGQGIGHSFRTFEERFEAICRSKAEQSFAFIFYDFSHTGLRTILEDQGVFTQLDRLSGERLSVFYLHSSGRQPRRFNRTFIKAIGVQDARIPCVVFFHWREGRGFTKVSVVPLEHLDLIHAFHELYGVLSDYMNNVPIDREKLRYLPWLTSGARFISLEAVRAALRAVFGHVPLPPW